MAVRINSGRSFLAVATVERDRFRPPTIEQFEHPPPRFPHYLSHYLSHNLLHWRTRQRCEGCYTSG